VAGSEGMADGGPHAAPSPPPVARPRQLLICNWRDNIEDVFRKIDRRCGELLPALPATGAGR
jgi:hypothetical protein